MGRAQRVLGVTPPLDRDQLHRAWLRELKRWHPDHNPTPEAVERTAQVNAAYELLREELRSGATPPLAAATANRSTAPGFAASGMWRPQRPKLVPRQEVAVPLPTAVTVVLWGAFLLLLLSGSLALMMAGSAVDESGYLHIGSLSPPAVALGVAELLLGVVVLLAPRLKHQRWRYWPLRLLGFLAIAAPVTTPGHQYLPAVLVLVAVAIAGLIITVSEGARRVLAD